MVDTTLSPLRIEATQRIDTKLGILEGWVTNGIPWKIQEHDGKIAMDDSEERILDFFPLNLSEFASWDGSRNCAATRAGLPEIRSMSRMTLNQSYHQARRAQVLSTISKLEQKAIEQREQFNKGSQMARLEAEVERLENVVKRQEQDVVTFRRKADRANELYYGLRATHLRAKKQYRSEIRALEAQVASLTKQVKRVVGFRKQ